MALQIVQHEQNSFSADYINSLKHSAYYMAESNKVDPVTAVKGWGGGGKGVQIKKLTSLLDCGEGLVPTPAAFPPEMCLHTP